MRIKRHRDLKLALKYAQKVKWTNKKTKVSFYEFSISDSSTFITKISQEKLTYHLNLVKFRSEV